MGVMGVVMEITMVVMEVVMVVITVMVLVMEVVVEVMVEDTVNKLHVVKEEDRDIHLINNRHVREKTSLLILLSLITTQQEHLSRMLTYNSEYSFTNLLILHSFSVTMAIVL